MTTTRRVIADIPTDWDVADDLPEHVHLLATSPFPIRDVRTNLVVIVVDAPGAATESSIDAHLADAVAALAEDDEVDVVDVLIDHDQTDDPDATIIGSVRQRILMERRFVDASGSVLAVAEVCQQHEWFDDRIVVSTITMPAPTPDEDDLAGAALDAQLLDDALAMLDSVTLEPVDH